MKLLLTLTLLTAVAKGASAQTPPPSPATHPTVTSPALAAETIKLKVLAKGTGVPVARAEVKIGGEKKFTDKAGEVAIAIPAGEGAVEVYRNSFESLTIPFADLRRKDHFDAYLFPAQPGDNEVLVRGAKRPEASRKNISIAEAVKVAPGGDPAQVPKLLPGVQSSSFRPDIVVRGSGPNDSLYLVDDFQVPFIFHRIGNISVIPDQLLSDVEFSSGGFGAQYGGITGGVIDLRTKSEVPERPKTEFRVNLPVYSSLYHERPINDGKDMVAISARRSYLDAILPLILKKQGADDLTVVPYFGDEHGFYFHPTDDGHVKVLLIHAYDGLHLLFPNDAATDDSGRGKFDLKDQFQLIGVEWKTNINKDWSVTVSPSVDHQENTISILDNYIDILVSTFAVHTELVHKLSGKDRIYYGLELAYAKADVSVLAPIQDENDPFFDFQEAPKAKSVVHKGFNEENAWVAMDKEFGPLLMTPGIRASHNTIINAGSLDPRLNARFQLNADNALKGAAGQYSETPQFQDADPNFGNPNIKFIRSYHYILGLETQWGDRWTTDFQTFYKTTVDMVRSDAATVKDNDGSQISAGFEAFIRRNLTERLFGWIAYTYSKTEDRDAPGDTYYNSQYDQTHILNLVGDYKLTGIWDLGGRFIYHTGDTTTAVDDAVYNANLDKYQQRRDENARPNNARLPSYHELDIFAERDSLYDTWKLTWRFGVEYIALERQAQGVQYNYDYSEKQYFRGIPPIPYVELRGIL